MIEKRRFPKTIIYLITAIVVAVVSALGVFLSLPYLLIGPDESRKADVIIQLAVRSEQPTDLYVAQLYREGAARNIMCISEQLTCGVFAADISRDSLLKSGVPSSDVYAIHLPLTDCPAQVAPLIISEIKKHGWKTALIVTSPVASRLIRRTFDESFKSNSVDLYVGFSPDDARLYTGSWWRHHKQTQQLVRESIESTLDRFYPVCR